MTVTADLTATQTPWLQRYYGVRALFCAVWVAMAFALGRSQPQMGALLLIAYPLWDCLANYVDARRTGGLRANPAQLLNAIVSAIVAIAVASTVGRDIHAAIAVIGVWAALAGILQLSTAVRRRRSVRAQWPMILSGAQSILAGAHFVMRSLDPSIQLSAATVAPYAAFGAFYFAVSAIVLAFKAR
jgi:uncharacterized membrane protein HdeD (DUF308 family)